MDASFRLRHQTTTAKRRCVWRTSTASSAASIRSARRARSLDIDGPTNPCPAADLSASSSMLSDAASGR